MTRDQKRRGEFEIIKRFFAPLSQKEAGAFGLTDDAAALTPKAGHDVVVTTDAIVAGVHFLPGDPPDTIARKALRVNLSDLAAKGATPRAYLLTAAFPHDIGDDWLKSFVAALKADQARYGITLVGGDTVATPGPLTLNVVALGEIARGRTVTRAGAKIGDDVWVTGTIGDAGLGLRLSKGDDLGLNERQRDALIRRYRVPDPRVALGQGLPTLATACLDVSDGLIADVGHIADVSKVQIRINATDVPLSHVSRAAMESGRTSLTEILTAGDDYELAFTAPPAHRQHLIELAAKAKTKIARVGEVARGKGVVARDESGRPLEISAAGYRHF